MFPLWDLPRAGTEQSDRFLGFRLMLLSAEGNPEAQRGWHRGPQDFSAGPFAESGTFWVVTVLGRWGVWWHPGLEQGRC